MTSFSNLKNGVGMNSMNILVPTSVALFVALTLPPQLAAQETPDHAREYPRFKLIDIGTFGGPNSGINGPNIPIISNNGVYAGESELNIPDPFGPNFCQDGDCLVQHAQKWRNGVMTDLGTLPGVDLSSGATWVSDNGNIGGTSENGEIDPLLGVPEIRAILWTNDGRTFDLGTLEGGYESFVPAVNDRGQVAGWGLNKIPDPFSYQPCVIYATCQPNSTQTRGFFWDHGFKQDLGTLGGPDALPEAMNNRGQIVGWSYTSFTPNANNGYICLPGVPSQNPFFWDKGQMVDIGTFGGTCGVAIFINNRGQVVGTSNLAGNQTHHAFLWERGRMKDLGTLGGPNAEADWISDSGLVVGRADVSMENSNHHAFLWKNGAMTDLGILDPWPCSTALSVNSKGQAIGDTGICGVGGGPNFYSQDAQPMVDINTLVLRGSDLQIVDLFSINERGEIAGAAVLPNGDAHAIVLVPADAEEIAAAGANNLSIPGAVAVNRVSKSFDSRDSRGFKTISDVLRQMQRLP
jgi:probable HAF family extracellular repeat protein